LFDEQQVELGRNFCNKLWNACRFRQMQEGAVEGEIEPRLLSSDDKWILLKLDQAIQELTEALAGYKFNEAAQILYRFFWSEYCDWYLEASKSSMMGEDAAVKTNTLAVIDFILSNMLRLFHPFTPFITEELWHGMGFHQELPPAQGGETIMLANWPKALGKEFHEFYGLDESDLKFVETRNQLISQGRNLRQAGNIPASKRVKFILSPAGNLPGHDLAAIKQLLNAEAVEVNAAYQPPKGTPSVHSELGTLYLPLAGLIDVDAEKARLTKEIAKVQAEIEKVQQKLGNPAFAQKVPATVLDEHRQRLVDWQAKHAQLKSAFDSLHG
jgi:valyl-tRNA synthetase